MLFEMRKQRLLQAAPRIVLAGEVAFQVQVKKGKAERLDYQDPDNTRSGSKLQILNVGSGDALRTRLNFDFLEAGAALQNLGSSFSYEIKSGFLFVKSTSYTAAFALSYLNNFPVGIVREDSDVPLNRPSIFDNLAMTLAECVVQKVDTGQFLTNDMTLTVPVKLNYEDARNTSFSDTQSITLSVVAVEQGDGASTVRLFWQVH
jgi:hypothetical protein